MLPDLIVAAITATHALVLMAFLFKLLWDFDPLICLVSVSTILLLVGIATLIVSQKDNESSIPS